MLFLQVLCTRKKAVWIILSIVLAVAAQNIVSLFSHTIDKHHCTSHPDFGDFNPTYWTWVYIAGFAVVPIPIVVVFNVAIIYKLIQMTRYRNTAAKVFLFLVAHSQLLCSIVSCIQDQETLMS